MVLAVVGHKNEIADQIWPQCLGFDTMLLIALNLKLETFILSYCMFDW